MKLEDVKEGIRVRTSERLRDTDGMMIRRKYLLARFPGTVGTVKGWVPGHGGDVWWVEHPLRGMAAYCYDEFEEAPEARLDPDPDVWEEVVPWTPEEEAEPLPWADEKPDPRLDTSAKLRAKHDAKPSFDPGYMAEKVEAARQRIPGDSPEEAEARRRWEAGERPPAEYQMMKYGASHAPVHSLYGIGHESRPLPKRMDKE